MTAVFMELDVRGEYFKTLLAGGAKTNVFGQSVGQGMVFFSIANDDHLAGWTSKAIIAKFNMALITTLTLDDHLALRASLWRRQRVDIRYFFGTGLRQH